ncbi:hypothetical protein [Polaromonas sp. YR568]|uniref:hypothetical protein n=1 Tax=Polaromonas sp. YR568 TaxID=1855301 RepID=UPI00398BE10E
MSVRLARHFVRSRWIAKGICLGASLALHGIVLLVGMQSGGSAKAIVRKEVPQTLAIHARLIPGQPRYQPETDKSVEIAGSNAPVEGLNRDPSSVIAENARPPLFSSSSRSSASLVEAQDGVVDLGDGIGLSNEPEYLPRNLLSVAPAAQTSIIIPYPPEVAGTGRYAGIFALFIDELGEVRSVRMEDQRLPPAMEQAVRQIFMQTRFSAGQRDGKDVKSRIRVEIVFDTI